MTEKPVSFLRLSLGCRDLTPCPKCGRRPTTGANLARMRGPAKSLIWRFFEISTLRRAAGTKHISLRLGGVGYCRLPRRRAQEDTVTLPTPNVWCPAFSPPTFPPLPTPFYTSYVF